MNDRDQTAIRHGYFAETRGFGGWRKPHYVALEHLDVVMANANKHFSENPERQLGGPKLPPKGRT